MTDLLRICHALLLTAMFATFVGARANAYTGVGTVYVSADRTESYQFQEHIAKYIYIYPKNRVPGQTFRIDNTDLLPDAGLTDCSDASFRCIVFGRSAFAVPRQRLSHMPSYVAAGNALKVMQCLRGLKDVCQVALIRVRCFVHPVHNHCEPSRDESLPSELLEQMYFIYNEDYGVTSFGNAPEELDASSAQMMNWATEYILVGDNGLLKP
jgi:hypothetical protein